MAMANHGKNRRTALAAATGAVAMLGLAYASVPLYRLFCQVTGLAARRKWPKRRQKT